MAKKERFETIYSRGQRAKWLLADIWRLPPHSFNSDR